MVVMGLGEVDCIVQVHVIIIGATLLLLRGVLHVSAGGGLQAGVGGVLILGLWGRHFWGGGWCLNREAVQPIVDVEIDRVFDGGNEDGIFEGGEGSRVGEEGLEVQVGVNLEIIEINGDVDGSVKHGVGEEVIVVHCGGGGNSDVGKVCDEVQIVSNNPKS